MIKVEYLNALGQKKIRECLSLDVHSKDETSCSIAFLGEQVGTRRGKGGKEVPMHKIIAKSYGVIEYEILEETVDPPR